MVGRPRRARHAGRCGRRRRRPGPRREGTEATALGLPAVLLRQPPDAQGYAARHQARHDAASPLPPHSTHTHTARRLLAAHASRRTRPPHHWLRAPHAAHARPAHPWPIVMTGLGARRPDDAVRAWGDVVRVSLEKFAASLKLCVACTFLLQLYNNSLHSNVYKHVLEYPVGSRAARVRRSNRSRRCPPVSARRCPPAAH